MQGYGKFIQEVKQDKKVKQAKEQIWETLLTLQNKYNPQYGELDNPVEQEIVINL